MQHTMSLTNEDITQPKRYTQAGNKLECWDFWLRYGLDPLIASAVKYVWRYKQKNGYHDLDKAKVFLDKAEKSLVDMKYTHNENLLPIREDYKGMDDLQFLFIANATLTSHPKQAFISIQNMKLVLGLINEQLKQGETNEKQEH